MYDYNEFNFKKYVTPAINKYVKRLLIIFFSTSCLLYFLLKNSIYLKEQIGIIYYLIGVSLTFCVMASIFFVIALKTSYTKVVKLFCRNYQFEIYDDEIIYYTTRLENINGVSNVTRKQYIIRNVSNYRDEDAKITIYGDILIRQCDPYAKKLNIKEFKRDKCYVLKGISNIEGFKKELERIKND